MTRLEKAGILAMNFGIYGRVIDAGDEFNFIYFMMMFTGAVLFVAGERKVSE